MSAGKFPSGTGFQIGFEIYRFLFIRKDGVGLHAPRHELGGVWASALVVFRKPFLKVPRYPCVVRRRVDQAAQDIHTVHWSFRIRHAKP